MSNKNLVPISNDEPSNNEQTDYTGIAILVTAGVYAFGMLLDYLSHTKKAKIKCSLFGKVNVEAEIENRDPD